MPKFDEKHIKICNCFVVWDGVTRPDQGPSGKPKYSLKVVVDPSSPDMALFGQLGIATLQESQWKGQLPAGGRMPIGQATASEFNGMFPGWAVLNCNSQRLPDVYDENGQLLDGMQYGNLLYGGQQVDVLVHCYAYDKAGNKGIATGLDGFSIITSANAQRQNFGSAGVDTSGAFGGGNPGYQNNNNQNGGGGGGNPGYQNNNNQNGGGGGGGGNPQTSGQTASPSDQRQPQQAHDFLPQQ